MAKRRVPSLNSFWKADIVDFHKVRKCCVLIYALRYICENAGGGQSGHENRLPAPRARVSTKTWSKNSVAIKRIYLERPCDFGLQRG